jgi:hypothetical protein
VVHISPQELENQAVTTSQAPCRYKSYKRRDGDASKGSFATLLSPPQCHSTFGTMPHTLASVYQSPVCVPRALPPPLRGRLGLDFGRGLWSNSRHCGLITFMWNDFINLPVFTVHSFSTWIKFDLYTAKLMFKIVATWSKKIWIEFPHTFFTNLFVNALSADYVVHVHVVVHVDGVRRCLWTAATNGPIVHLSHDVSMEGHGGMILTGKLKNF